MFTEVRAMSNTVRKNQIWIQRAQNMIIQFSKQRNMRGWNVQFFGLASVFKLFLKEMGKSPSPSMSTWFMDIPKITPMEDMINVVSSCQLYIVVGEN